MNECRLVLVCVCDSVSVCRGSESVSLLLTPLFGLQAVMNVRKLLLTLVLSGASMFHKRTLYRSATRKSSVKQTPVSVFDAD